MLTRVGYGAECATWRTCFLLGAQEIHGEAVLTQVGSAGMASALSVTQLFDNLAIRIDGRRAWDGSLSIRWQFTDSAEAYRMELSCSARSRGSTDGLHVEGDPTVFTRLLLLTEEPAAAFAMVTP